MLCVSVIPYLFHMHDSTSFICLAQCEHRLQISWKVLLTGPWMWLHAVLSPITLFYLFILSTSNSNQSPGHGSLIALANKLLTSKTIPHLFMMLNKNTPAGISHSLNSRIHTLAASINTKISSMCRVVSLGQCPCLQNGPPQPFTNASIYFLFDKHYVHTLPLHPGRRLDTDG